MRIGIIGKYVSLPDAYLSVVESLNHAGFHHGADVSIDWIQAEDVEGLLAAGRLKDLDGIVIPGGFGERGIEGKIAAAGYAREHEIPCLGICLGMQVMTVEYARNVLGLAGANSTEFDPTTPHPVIDLMDSQRDVTKKGGTMRLGAQPAMLEPGSIVQKAYGKEVISERHRHRYEFNPAYRRRFDGSDFRFSGTSPDGRLVEFIELAGHPYWVATQAHPEFKSRPTNPAPLFRELIGAAKDRASGRNPQLIDVGDEDRPGGAEGQRPAAAFRQRGVSGFRHLDDRVLHRGHVITLCESEFEAPDGSRFQREIVRHPGAVSVVALTDDEQVVMVRQYRAAVDDMVLEIPAGKRDVADEPPELTARRELIEEVGLDPGSLTLLARFHNSIGFTDEESFVFLGTDLVEVTADRQGIEESYMEVVHVPLAATPAMIASGELTDGKSIIGVTLAAARLAATLGD